MAAANRSNFPGNEVQVGSWDELMSAIRGLVPRQDGDGGHLRSPYTFRGMDVADWPLLTSLQRIQQGSSASTSLIENSLIRSFRKYANAGSFDDKSEWYVLAVAQHNGLPTRCLDWTSSPLVAAHFACGDGAYKNNDGAIWCLDVGILRQINKAVLASLRGISWVYDTRKLEQDYGRLNDLDKTHRRGSRMFLWEPPSLDARIANQSGLLSIMNSPEDTQHDFLRRLSAKHPGLVVRIVIAASAKSEIRDMLDQNNVSERMLFPGLPGLCSWLKRYYGRAW